MLKHRSRPHLASLFYACAALLMFNGESRSEPIAHWRFEATEPRGAVPPVGSDATVDSTEPQGGGVGVRREGNTSSGDKLTGFYRIVPGAAGKALRMGGIDSYIECETSPAALLEGQHTIAAWIALGAYPFNLCPIAAQATENSGVVFGIDAHGRLTLQAAVDGTWETIAAQEGIPLGAWTHVACTLEPGVRMAIYVNGQLVRESAITGSLSAAKNAKLLIGRHPVAQYPFGTIRPYATAKVPTYFDGILDELQILDRALTPQEILGEFEALVPAELPQLPVRRLPGFSEAKAEFGAHYATLSYYDAWDARWQVGDAADVVVRFDETPCEFIFWRGASYIPHWVTENDIWFNNEFVETWDDKGCHEPMSDKQCRFGHVRILESSPARAVVQWRYALADNWYSIFRQEEENDWGEWVDEVHTIYPDGVGVRKITLYSSDPKAAPHEWNEAIVTMGPGQRPEDVLEPAPITLLNTSGESHTYSWVGGPPPPPDLPQNATIERVNTKSKFRPFAAFPADSQPVFDIYAGEQRPEVSMFPWFNHWPTAFDPCDGRYAMAADRAAHSSLTHCTWGVYQETERTLTKIMLNGVTDKSATDLACVVRSWDSPPELSVVAGDFAIEGYEPAERAYLLRRTGDSANAVLKFAATSDSPIENLAIVVRGWGDRAANIRVDGKQVQARIGWRTTLDGKDLIVWVPSRATKRIDVEISSN